MSMRSWKSTRNRLALSQQQFADLLGVHPMTISKWERGVLEPNEHQRGLLRALSEAAERGLKASPKHYEPLRFLAEVLAQPRRGTEIDLGTLSATNRFSGTIVEIARGDVMSKVVIEITRQVRIGAVITTDSVDRLGLEIGSRATAIIKATEVIVGRS
jgi:molybdopterin-binding protein